jgi:ribosomal protein L34
VVRRNKPDRTKEHHMTTYSIDTDNNLAVHPDKDAAMKEAGATGAAFATEEQLSEVTAMWPASRLVDTWNGFAGAPPFAELKEVKRFTDRKSAVARIWNAAQRLGETLEEEMRIAEQDMLRAQQEMLSATKVMKRPKNARTAAPKAPAKPRASKDATKTDGAPAPKQREGTRKATVLALLERAGGATLEEIMAETAWQKHSVRGFISTLASKGGYTVVSTRRETGRARVYSIAK